MVSSFVNTAPRLYDHFARPRDFSPIGNLFY